MARETTAYTAVVFRTKGKGFELPVMESGAAYDMRRPCHPSPLHEEPERLAPETEDGSGSDDMQWLGRRSTSPACN